MNDTSLNIAIIGCGAVSEQFHLPSLGGLHIRPVALVDRNTERAKRLADAFGVPRVYSDYNSCIREFDAAIVALPHHLHATVCSDLLRRGIHVLVEKPMALTKDECQAMVAAAEEGKAVLAVGLIRRFLHSAQWVKAMLDAEILGRIESFEFREGLVYDWPVASDFFFRKETAGGGVLMDTGAHTLDMLLWWLGDVADLQYCDDSYGGVEADCEVHLTMESGGRGVVELSRTRDLRNTAIVEGERGTLEFHFHQNWVALRLPNATTGLAGYAFWSEPAGEAVQGLGDLFRSQLEDWLGAIRDKRAPAVSGMQARRSVALIEECYARRERLRLPWMDTEALLRGHNDAALE